MGHAEGKGQEGSTAAKLAWPLWERGTLTQSMGSLEGKCLGVQKGCCFPDLLGKRAEPRMLLSLCSQ